MRRIVLIACSKSKLDRPTPAAEVYQGGLFKLSLRYARSLEPDAIYILSAKYGLVPLRRKLKPYDKTLNTMSRAEIARWAEQRVLPALRRVSNLKTDAYVVLAGTKYRRDLQPHLENVRVPLKGRRIGEQLQYLKRRLHERVR